MRSEAKIQHEGVSLACVLLVVTSTSNITLTFMCYFVIDDDYIIQIRYDDDDDDDGENDNDNDGYDDDDDDRRRRR